MTSAPPRPAAADSDATGGAEPAPSSASVPVRPRGGGPVDVMLGDLHRSLVEVRGGEVADYIPELSKAPADAFGIALATLDGHVYEAGDAREEFTIQSVSKPFVYSLTLADRGLSAVLDAIGVEPTGDPFNSITVDQETGRPYNPMVNAGAIVAASLVEGRDGDEQFERIRAHLSAFAGRELHVDDAVYRSETETGDRNRAIAYFMRTVGALSGDVDTALDVYFRQCSLLVTARDLAVMSATLSNGGRNPVTGEEVLAPEYVSRVLAVMSTCGMYDYAGEWMYRVGLPAKSGVSGGIAVALSDRLGIGLWSPRLDRRGNSVRGIAACEQLSQRLGLHVLGSDASPGPPTLRARSGAEVRSNLSRTPEHQAVLEQQGGAIRLYELLSDQTFLTAEAVLRTALADDDCRWAVLDMRRAATVDTAAARLFEALVAGRARDGLSTAVVAPAVVPLADALAEAGAALFESQDAALEWAETSLLTEALGVEADSGAREFADQELLHDMTPEDVAVLAPLMQEHRYDAGAIVFDEGDPADRLHFVMAGQATVALRTGESGERWSRLITVVPGTSFGEVAAIDGGTRSTRVIAEEGLVTLTLSVDDLTGLRETHPSLVAHLYQGMARSLAARLRNANRAIAALQS